MKLIDKDAIVAEINRVLNSYDPNEITSGRYALVSLRDFLDTLEVKEVDLDFMLHEYWDISPKICVDCLESATMTKDEMINFAKHFFELGLKAQKGE